MIDPTREEMLEALQEHAKLADGDEFDIEEAIYWYASHYHGGQGSNLYEALSLSPYSPGPCMRELNEEDSLVAAYLYSILEAMYSSQLEMDI
jgi:hypothetical protein